MAIIQISDVKLFQVTMPFLQVRLYFPFAFKYVKYVKYILLIKSIEV